MIKVGLNFNLASLASLCTIWKIICV